MQDGTANAGSGRVRQGLTLATLALGTFLGFLNFALLSPLLPGISATFAVPGALAGQLATLSALVAFAVSLAAAPWLDRLTPRAWVRIEGALLLAGTLLSAGAPSFGWLAAGRVVAGLGAAVLGASVYAAARHRFPEAATRNRVIGLMVSAGILAYIVGLPILTQIDAARGWRAAVLATAVPTGALLVGSALLPGERAGEEGVGSGRAVRAVLGHPQIPWLYAVLALTIAAYSGWLVYFGSYARADFGVSAATLSGLFLGTGLVELVGNNVVPLVLARVGAARMLLLGVLTVALPLLLTGAAVRSVPGVFVAATMMNVGSAVVIIATNAWLLEAGADAPGATMSLASASTELGNVLGPATAGWALATLGAYAGAYRVLGAVMLLALPALLAAARAGRSGAGGRADPPGRARGVPDEA